MRGNFSYHIARREAEARGMTLAEYGTYLNKRKRAKRARLAAAERKAAAEERAEKYRESRPDLYD